MALERLVELKDKPGEQFYVYQSSRRGTWIRSDDCETEYYSSMLNFIDDEDVQST